VPRWNCDTLLENPLRFLLWSAAMERTTLRAALGRASSRLLAVLGAAPGAAATWLRADPARGAAAGLLLAGLVARLVFLPDARFTGDESLFWEVSLGVADLRWFPTLGPAVTGGPLHHPGGTFYLLMSLPLFLTTSPLAPMVLVVLLNLAGYALLYTTFRRVVGRRAALVFLALLVFNPASFFYSDRIWNSNLVLPLTALVLWGLVDAVQRPRSARIGWTVFALALYPQFHLSVVLLVPVVLTVWAVHRPRLNGRAALWGLVAAAALYVPYLVHELGSGFANTRLLGAAMGAKADALTEAVRGTLGFLLLPTAEPSYFAARGYWFDHHVLRWYGGEGPGVAGTVDFLGGGAPGALLAAAAGFTVAVMGACVLGLFVAVAVSGRARRALLRQNPLVPAFLAALAVVPLLLALSKKSFVPHYVFPLYPLAFVPVVVAVERLTRRRAAFVVAGALTAVVAVADVGIAARFYDQVDATVGYDSSAEVVRAVYDVGRDRSCRIGFDIEKSRLDARPYVRLAAGHFGRPIHEVDDADLRFRVFDHGRYAWFRSLPEPRQRIDGARVAGTKTLEHVVLVWGDRALPTGLPARVQPPPPPAHPPQSR